MKPGKRGRSFFLGLLLLQGFACGGGGGGEGPSLVPAPPPPPLNDCSEPWPLDRFLLIYGGEIVGNMPDEYVDAIALRFQFGIGDLPQSVKYLMNRPGSVFQGTYRYNSLTDNYVTSESGTPEHDWLVDHATDYGVTNDGMYLHYWTDTRVDFYDAEVTIRGFGNGSASNAGEARIPVYYSNLSRRATGFSTAAARALHRDFNIEEVLNTPIVDDIYPLGVFFDNSTTIPYNFGTIESGGEVREHPTHEIFGSDDYSAWHWESSIGLFMNEMRAFADASNHAATGGRVVVIMPNISNTPFIETEGLWEDAYTNFLVGGNFNLFEEFQYSPTRAFGSDMPRTVYEKELAAHQNGISTTQPGYAQLTMSGLEGSYTWAEAAMNNLGMHWVIRSEDEGADARSYFLGVQENDPNNLAEFSQNLYRAFDADLGVAQGAPYVLKSGTDDKGYAYKVYARQFACGLAATRVRGDYNEDFDKGTAVNVNLGGTYVPVEPDGTLGDETTSWSFRNGSGQIFLLP